MSAQLRCVFCNEGAGARDASLGDLMGPVGHTGEGEPIHVHRQCALWSPEVSSRAETCPRTPAASHGRSNGAA